MGQENIACQINIMEWTMNLMTWDERGDCIQAGLNTLVGWGLKMFMKVLGLVSYMEKMISDFYSDTARICKIPDLVISKVP